MHTNMSIRPIVLALLWLAACSDGTAPEVRQIRASVTAAPVGPNFKIRILSNLDGNDVTVTGFNRHGVVAGYRTNPMLRVFRSGASIEYFTPPSGFQPGDPFSPELSFSVGINARGTVASQIFIDTSQRAFVWRYHTTTLLDPTYPASEGGGLPLGCGAWNISDSGYVVGMCMPNSNWFVAEWGPDLTIVKMDCCGVLTAMSENQWLTGYDLNGPPRALRWSPGVAFYDVIGVYNNQPQFSKGLAVNSHGWVAGWGQLSDTAPLGADTAALLWVPGSQERVLSHLGQATGVDDAGNVVGFHKDTPTGPTVAFLWNFATGAHFLPGLPHGGATAAVAISSERREILGSALDSQGLKHAVIWTF